MVGTLAEHVTISEQAVVKIDESIPLEAAALLGCGVVTGWGSAVYAGNVGPGDTVVVYGSGGVGVNAVQGAVLGGAKNVIVVDPVDFKREFALKMGATHTFADPAEAQEAIIDLTRGQLADVAIVTASGVRHELVSLAVAAVGKLGTVVLTGLPEDEPINVRLSGAEFAMYQKTLRGTLFGMCNPHRDIGMLAQLYQAGQLRLDELVTRRYTLDQVNQGYSDMDAGLNIRGVVVHSTS
jgi:alcohol dehydrogenase (nicotinoprotein)